MNAERRDRRGTAGKPNGGRRIVYVVQGRGVRVCRYTAPPFMREREHLEVRIEVARDPKGTSWSRPQWVPAVLVYADEATARELWLRAKAAPHDDGIAATAVAIVPRGWSE